jgi:hypothetical protein
MYQPFAQHPGANSHFVEQIDGGLFEDAGADAFLTIFAAARFEHHGVDAAQMEQMREDQARGTGADDAHLSLHAEPAERL